MRSPSGAVALVVIVLMSGCTGDDGADGATAPASTPPMPSASVPPSGSMPPSRSITEVEPPAPDRTGLPEVVTVTGTVQAGAESGCLLLDGLLLIGGSPEVLQPGNRVTVTGRPDPTLVTFCQQGIPLVVTTAEDA